MVIFYRKGKKVLRRKFDDFVPSKKGVEIELDDVTYIVSNVTLRLNKNDVDIDLEEKV